MPSDIIFDIGDYLYQQIGSSTNVKAMVGIDRRQSSYSAVPATVEYEGVVYTVTSMYGCYSNCVNMTEAPPIPSTVTDMEMCFNECKKLASAPAIPSGVTNVVGCFQYCEQLTAPPTMPSGITSMERCFQGCSSLESPPTIPSGVTTMRYCFSYCYKLASAPVIPSGVTDMAYCFNACTRLASAPTIPSGVTNLEGCFRNCTIAAAPTIPSTVVNMGACFFGCNYLTAPPTIPASVLDVTQAFFNCVRMTGTMTVSNTPTRYSGVFGNYSGVTSMKDIILSLDSAASLDTWTAIASQYSYVYLPAANTAPSLQLSATRCNSSGTADDEGTYAKLTAVATLYEDNVPAGTNDALYPQLKVDGAIRTSSWSDVVDSSGLVHTLTLLLSLGDQSGHAFTMSVTDRYSHTSETIAVTLPNAAPALDFVHDDTSGNDGAAFGKVATQAGVVDSAWPISSDGEVSAKSGSTVHNLTEKGPAISSYELRYQQSSSGTTIPTGTWQTSPPSATAGYYLWTRMVYTYSDGSSYTAYAVARNGSNGSTPTTYIIEPSCSQVIHDGSAFNPTSITFYSYYYGAYSYSRTSYSRYWVVEYSTDGSTWNAVSATTSSSTSYTLTLSNVSSSAKFIRVRTRSSSSGGTYYATYILPVIFSTTGVTGVKGAYESSYRTGNVNLTLNNLAFLGVNPTGGTSNDTCTWWRNKGTGYAWISATGQLNGQPAQYGFLINIVYGGECHQEFWVQSDGQHFKRGGNGSTEAMPSWSLDFTGKTLIGGYYGIEVPENSGGKYVRAPEAGIIPYTSGGNGYLGTSGWPWAAGYFNALYVNGNSLAPSFGSGNSEIVFTIANSGGTERLALIYDGSNNRLVVDLYKNGSWKGRKTMAQW